MLRKIVKFILWILLAGLLFIGFQTVRNWDTIQRVFLGGVKVYESTPPTLPQNIARPAILVFSKTSGFRHEEAIPAARDAFTDIAKEKGWGIFQTENGAAFSPEILAKFDAVVFSNTSGDVFTPDQRAAFKAFLENGGGYVGIHAAGDDSHKAWDWYLQDLIGAKFIGHPINPQFQKATIRVEDRTHPATQHLGETWQRTDEWYSFDRSPRKTGVTVLATLDETSYIQKGMFGSNLAMGKDHPIIWTRCIGKGRVLYSALGHTAESFTEPANKKALTGALNWALKLEGKGCNDTHATPQQIE